VKVRHLMVPGLSARHLEQAELRELLGRDDTMRSELVSSFPATLAVQETTLLTGWPPRRHGVLFGGEDSRVPELIRPWHARADLLLEGGSLADLAARLDEEVSRHDALLVSGAPVGQPGCRPIGAIPAAPEGFRLQLSDCFALCTPLRAGTELPGTVIDEWLRTPGIERVLAPSGESAGAWMAPDDRGWILVTERGWQFGDAEVAYGRPESDGAVLLGLGMRWPSPWPSAVHDWRVAPTVLALAGEPPDDDLDAPLDGAAQLGG
jgi:hypothetical protein